MRPPKRPRQARRLQQCGRVVVARAALRLECVERAQCRQQPRIAARGIVRVRAVGEIVEQLTIVDREEDLSAFTLERSKQRCELRDVDVVHALHGVVNDQPRQERLC